MNMRYGKDYSLPQRIWRAIRRWEPLYWLRTHTYNRYHIIDLRGQGDYKWGWIDRSHAMYLACFKLLQDFVEQEDPTIGLRGEEAYRGKPTDEFYVSDEEWNKYHKPSIDHQLANEREVRVLYDWWKTGRKQEFEALDKILDGYHRSFDDMFKPCSDKPGLFEYVPDPDPRWEAWKAEHDRLEAKDEEMLQRLMKVRQTLWT
jgi:hypothetical protein